jgi:hypothetical protein
MPSRIFNAFRASDADRAQPSGAATAKFRHDPVPHITRLRLDCAEAYHVVGSLASHLDCLDHPDVVRSLENLAAAAKGKKRPHEDLLPWPNRPLPLPHPEEDRAIALAVHAIAVNDGHEAQPFARDILMFAATLVEGDKIQQQRNEPQPPSPNQ